MKYIMLETLPEDSKEYVKKLIPIIFPDFMTHGDMADTTINILKEVHKIPCQIRSAGSIAIEVESCYGSSETLDVEAEDIDVSVINWYDCLHGLIY